MNYFDKLFSNVVSNLGRNFSRSFVLCYMRELPAKDIILYALSRARTLKVLNVSGEAIILVQKYFFQRLSVILFSTLLSLGGKFGESFSKVFARGDV